MKDYWVDRRQVIGFIGSVFIMLSIFLPFYQINLFSFGQITIPLVDIPVVGATIASILIIMGIVSIVALGFEEYTLLYLTGFISLAIVLLMFVFTELGFMIVSNSLPVVVSKVVNYLVDYDFGWVVLLAGSGFLLVVPKL
jgi:hypothetical protein